MRGVSAKMPQREKKAKVNLPCLKMPVGAMLLVESRSHYFVGHAKTKNLILQPCLPISIHLHPLGVMPVLPSFIIIFGIEGLEGQISGQILRNGFEEEEEWNFRNGILLFRSSRGRNIELRSLRGWFCPPAQSTDPFHCPAHLPCFLPNIFACLFPCLPIFPSFFFFSIETEQAGSREGLPSVFLFPFSSHYIER